MRRIPESLAADRFGHRQSNPHPPPALAVDLNGAARLSFGLVRSPGQVPSPSKYILSGRRIDRSVQGRPAVPCSSTPRRIEPTCAAAHGPFSPRRLQRAEQQAGDSHPFAHHRPSAINLADRTSRSEHNPNHPNKRGFHSVALTASELHPPCSRKGPYLGGNPLKSSLVYANEVTFSIFRVLGDLVKKDVCVTWVFVFRRRHH